MPHDFDTEIDHPIPEPPSQRDTEPPAPFELKPRLRSTCEVLGEIVFHCDEANQAQKAGDSDRVIEHAEQARELIQEVLSHFGEDDPPEDEPAVAPPPPVAKGEPHPTKAPEVVEAGHLLALAAGAIDAGYRRHGKPLEFCELCARLWSELLGVEIGPGAVPHMMVAFKLARLRANPAHVDSWADVAGYAAIGAEVVTRTIAATTTEPGVAAGGTTR